MSDSVENANEAKAYALAIRFLGLRPRSEYEVRSYLARKGFETEIIELILTKLEEIGLVNDLEFAASWIASRQAVRPRSKRVLEQELMTKRVSRDTIAIALQELDEEDELAPLMRIIERKRRLPQYQDARRLEGYLGRQGYTYGIIKKALERLDE